MMPGQMRSGCVPDSIMGILNYINRKKGGEKMETIIKAVVIGVLTVAIAALEQSGGDEV